MKHTYLTHTLTILLCLFVPLSADAGPLKRHVVARQTRQHARVVEGIKSGEINKVEAREIRKDEKEIREMKLEARADGEVTKDERKEISEALNEASQDIFEAKHD